MHDLRSLRQDVSPLRESQRRRRGNIEVVDQLMALDEEHRACQTTIDALRAQRNEASKEIGNLKKSGQDASSQMEAVKGIGDAIKAAEERMTVCDIQRNELLLTIPNILDVSVPEGDSEDDNILVRDSGPVPPMEFEPQAHDDIGVTALCGDHHHA